MLDVSGFSGLYIYMTIHKHREEVDVRIFTIRRLISYFIVIVHMEIVLIKILLIKIVHIQIYNQGIDVQTYIYGGNGQHTE